MNVEVVKFRIMNCSTCNRDTLMAEVNIKTTPNEPIPKYPLMYFCSGCGHYFEMERASPVDSKPKKSKRQEGPTGPE